MYNVKTRPIICFLCPSAQRTVVGKLVIAIGEVVWPPETANMFKRLLNLVGVTRSIRLSYTSSRSSEYDQKWCSSSKHNDDCPCVEVSSITLYHFITPLIVANIMEGVIGGVVIRIGRISPYFFHNACKSFGLAGMFTPIHVWNSKPLSFFISCTSVARVWPEMMFYEIY